MSDTYVAGYWGNRAVSAADCAQSLESFLRQLGQHCDELGTWYRKGRSRKAALSQPIVATNQSLEKILLSGQRRNPGRASPTAATGLEFSAWNGGDSSLNLDCGIENVEVVGLNVVILRLGDLDLQPSPAEKILDAIVDCWSPDWATWSSTELRSAQGAGPGDIVVGALTYLSWNPGTDLADHGNVRPWSSGFKIAAGETPDSTSVEVATGLMTRLRERSTRTR